MALDYNTVYSANNICEYIQMPQYINDGSHQLESKGAEEGDIIFRKIKGTEYCHFGIYENNDTVYDLSGNRVLAGVERPVRVINLEQFADGESVYIYNFRTTNDKIDLGYPFSGRICSKPKDVIKKARKFVNYPDKYNSFSRNCAQFAFYCKCEGFDKPEDVMPFAGQMLSESFNVLAVGVACISILLFC